MSNQLLDVRWLSTPFNKIKVKRVLEQMKTGETLEVFCEAGSSLDEVCEEILSLGAKIEHIEKIKNKLAQSSDCKIQVLKLDF